MWLIYDVLIMTSTFKKSIINNNDFHVKKLKSFFSFSFLFQSKVKLKNLDFFFFFFFEKKEPPQWTFSKVNRSTGLSKASHVTTNNKGGVTTESYTVPFSFFYFEALESWRFELHICRYRS